MTTYTLAWIMWIVMFFAIELPALLNRQPGDTLSYHIRQWASLRGKSTGWQLRRLALVVFLVWLPMHLLFDWA